MTEQDTGPASPRIAYVASVTHSGSTLVDLVLGSHSQIASCGELKVLCRARDAKRARVLADRCTCGAPTKLECAFWRDVDRRLLARIGVGLQAVDVDAPDYATFVLHNRALFDAIAAVAGTRWLVDSSKSAHRLRRLLACGQFDVRPIHLTRSPYGVAYSHRRKGRSTVSGALRYSLSRVRLQWLLRGVPHAALGYEAFVRDPGAELARVMRWLGLELEPRQLDWASHVHHNVCGNHMRFATTSEIRSDEAWRRGLSRPQKALIALVAGPAQLASRWIAGPTDAPLASSQSSSTAR